VQMPIRPPKTRLQEFTAALGEHLHKVKLIVYGSLLIVGGVQIVIRERFPNVHPPWPLIGGLLMVVLLGVVLLPPLLLFIHVRKKPDSEKQERHRSPAAAQDCARRIENGT
jgi:hypothetical protein